MILARIENWKHYAGLGPNFRRGLELLAGGSLDALADGKHELDGENLYASVQQAYPKASGEGRWEAHRRYADIQYVVSGCEAMGYCPVEALKTAEPYQADKDIVFFGQGPEAGTLLKVEPGMFAVFFPSDAHMPLLSWETLFPGGSGALQTPVLIKKIVLKVKLGA